MLEKQKYLKKLNVGEIEIFKQKLKWRNRNIKINKYVNVGEVEILKKIMLEKQKY